ncbi:MAG: S-adenosylmethionine decarboxylase [Nanoarchaeota archaeon]
MNEKLWGKSAMIDLVGCNENIKQPKKIQEFIDKLCSAINMKKHGQCHIERFGYGKLEGWSFMQFIETSSITGHFDEQVGSTNLAFIDIFSCKNFDEKKAALFCKKFFQAERVRLRTLKRTYT